MFQRVYHITHRCHRERILAEGLKPQGWQSPYCKWSGLKYPPRIYVSTVKEDRRAMDFVGLEGLDMWTFVVWKFQLQKDTVSSSPQHYYLTHSIPPYSLRLQSTRW